MLFPEGEHFNFWIICETFNICRYCIGGIKCVKCFEKFILYSVCKYCMRRKSRDFFCSFFSCITSGLDKCSSWSNMIVYDDNIFTNEISSLEVHLDIIGRFSYFCTSNNFIFSKKSGKSFFCSCIRKEYDWLIIQRFYFIFESIGSRVMVNLEWSGKIEYFTFIMDIIEMYVYSSWITFSYESKSSSKNIGNREFSTRSISFHRCRRKKWYINMEKIRTWTHQSIEECNLSKVISNITKITNIHNILVSYIFFIFEEYSRPTIRKFLESNNFPIWNYFEKMSEVRMNKCNHKK